MTFAPRELAGVTIDQRAPIRQCQFCRKPIWWGLTARKKKNPFDVLIRPDGSPQRTAITHWSTCTEREQASRQFQSQR